MLLGVAAAGWWGPAPWWVVAGLALLGLAGGVLRLRYVAVLVLVAALALGLARGGHHVASQPPPLHAAAGTELQVEGTVVDTRPGTRRTIEVTMVRLPGSDASVPVAGQMELFAPRGVAPPGARVVATGVFEPAPSAERNRLAVSGSTFVGRLDASSIRVLEQGEAPDSGWLPQLRQHIDRSLRAALPEPHGSLLSAMLVGMRHGLPTGLRDDFVSSGLIHIVAISGFNITLVALAIRRLAGWVIGRYGVTLAAVLLPLYAVLAGAEPSVVRATIMGELLLLAWIAGRDADTLTALSLAGAAMVLVQPQALADVGFQLSFAGTVGLVVLAPWLARFLRERLRAPRLAAEFLAGTVAASVMVTPIIAHTFGRFQMMAVPANLLALAAPPWVMATGIPLAGWASLGLPGTETVAWAAWVPLEYLIRSAQIAAGLPGASVPVEGFDLTYAAVSYGCLAAAVVLLGRAGRTEPEGPPAALRVPRAAALPGDKLTYAVVEPYLTPEIPAVRKAAAAVAESCCAGETDEQALLLRLAEDDDPAVRAAAAGSLSRCGSADAVAPLVAALQSPHLSVRDNAAASLVALGRAGHQGDVLPATLPLVRDGSIPALEVLQRLPDPAATSILEELVEGPDPAVRGHAALALGAIGDHRARKALMGREAIEEDAFVRWCLARALRTPGNAAAINPELR